jgi:hypothetical protein
VRLLRNVVGISGRTRSRERGRDMRIAVATGALIAMAALSTNASAHDSDSIKWTRNGAPIAAAIKDGPWTLEQSGAANGLKSSGYCDNAGHLIGNPGTERMEPYYFPFIVGQGSQLQGYFDYRPKDTDEAVVAASSNDGGLTWNFQSQVLDLNHAPGGTPARSLCPMMANKEPDGEKDGICTGSSCQNADNGDDDGQGHQFVINIGGKNLLYTLNRSVGHIDQDDLVS